MNHLDEQQLILHYYGEEDDAAAAEFHLDECPRCRALYGGVQRVLNLADALPVPERGDTYAAEVWDRIGHGIGAARPRLRFPVWRWAVAATAFAGLMAVAFLAGRFSPRPPRPGQAAADSQVRERVLLVAVGDYLERSQMVLIELANANPKGALDISSEQARASDLVTETRLYRQTANHTGDVRVAGVLDEIERVLLRITHAPSPIPPAELEDLRRELESEGILFKIRVLDANVRHRKEGPDGQKL